MVGKSWIVFTIQVLVEKYISGPQPSLGPCSETHAQIVKKLRIENSIKKDLNNIMAPQ